MTNKLTTENPNDNGTRTFTSGDSLFITDDDSASILDPASLLFEGEEALVETISAENTTVQVNNDKYSGKIETYEIITDLMSGTKRLKMILRVS